jgi:predicted CxxxxCH...CXXCH cytochrome family protein
VVEGATSADLPYTSTTDNPDQYSINYDATAEGQGFVDVSLAALPESPIVLAVPAAAIPATYNGTLTVTNSGTGLTSGDYTITVTITPGTPTINITDANPSVGQGETSAEIPYSATTYNPDQYSIDYDATAEAQGFSDVSLAALPSSPIVCNVPAGAALDTYNGTLTVTNTTSGLTSGDYPVTITVTVPASPPTITIIDPNPSVSQGTSSAVLYYSATTNSPDLFSIDYDGTAEGAGFADVADASLQAGQIDLVVPGGAALDTYNGILTVKNSTSGLSSVNYNITITISSEELPPTITLGAYPTICAGTTDANLTYSSTTESPDLYSIDYFLASESEGFVDVTDAALPASPVVMVVPGGAAPGTYYGNLTVKNSTSGLSSGIYSISVTVITIPETPAYIFGSQAVPEQTTGLSYAIVAVPGATSYLWTVPAGWNIEPDLGTSTTTTSPSITVTSGIAGENGNVTVRVNSPCGSSGTQTLSVTSETPLDHSLYGCNACHITHNALGGSLTNVFGNSNLCLSCHVTGGAASGKAFINSDKADPSAGTGTSHSWDVQSVNATYETVLTSDPEMVLRVDEGNIVCSTCHDQHNANTNPNYTRISNVGDAMCKDCHSPRNVGRYTDDNTNNKGSHPVGLTYSGTGDFEATPLGSVTIPGGKIECTSCHMAHYAATTDGNLLRQTNDNALCTSCHTYGTHNGANCLDCHQAHNTNKDNIYMIRNTITTPNSGNRTVVFTSLTGNGSFADNDADGNSTWDGVCEVCHTLPASSNHHNFEPADPADSDHYSGQNCTTCHPHSSNFSPSGGGCITCHEATPTYLSDVHQKHMLTYGYACSTCHFGHGSGGASEGTHPSGTKDVVFDPNGMATRNGLDSNTPDPWTGTTCGNIYCHSNGVTADRGSEGVANWGLVPSSSQVYVTTPDWSTGSITACGACHAGPLTMPAAPDYTIVEGNTTGQVTAGDQYPNTGAHGSNTGAHNSPDQLINLTEVEGTYGTALSHSWPKVQCFWCHNNDPGAASGEPKKQGTYGTARHVDGRTWFYPGWYGYGGFGEKTSGGQAPDYYLMDTEAEINALGSGYVWHPDPADPERVSTMIPGLGYAWMGPTNEHCGNGKNCW